MARADQARANVLAAEAAVSQARIELGYTRVTSPIKGQVGEALVTEGALVEAATATPMAIVQQISPIYIDINQPVAQRAHIQRLIDAGDLRPVQGDDAHISIKLDQTTAYAQPARLMFAGMRVDRQTGQVILRAEVENPKAQLLPGMLVRVHVPQAVSPAAILLPPQAIQRGTDGRPNVYVVSNDRADRRPVSTNGSYQGQVLVTEGVQADDVVVVAGFQKIRSGAPVQTKPWQPKTGQ
jgi:membrane fusion protein (multidrug efflux system)